MSDRDQLLEKLNSGRDEFLASLNGVTEEQAAARPVTGWAILECAEHVAIVEENLRRRLMEQATPTGSEMSREREAFIAAVAANRGRKIQAPEVAHPCGRFATLAEAVECFCRNREQTIAYVTSCQEDLRGGKRTGDDPDHDRASLPPRGAGPGIALTDHRPRLRQRRFYFFFSEGGADKEFLPRARAQRDRLPSVLRRHRHVHLHFAACVAHRTNYTRYHAADLRRRLQQFFQNAAHAIDDAVLDLQPVLRRSQTHLLPALAAAQRHETAQGWHAAIDAPVPQGHH